MDVRVSASLLSLMACSASAISMTLPLPAGFAAQLREPPVCHCFSLCKETEARRFRARLPTIARPGDSPWYGYLRAIYADALRLPFDTSTLQVLYTTLLPPLRLGSQCAKPFRACNASQAHCAAWTAPEPPASGSEHAAHAPHRGAAAQRLLTMVTMWEGTTAESIQFMEQTEAIASHGWAEVLRRTASPRGGGGACPGEGVGYGCWFMLTRGSGVFVNVGRTRVVSHHGALTAYKGGGSRDCTYAWNETMQLEYDSLQLLWGDRTGHELLMATPSCMKQPRVLPGPCVPLPLRRGADPTASSCACNNSFAFINCAGCDPGYPMATPRIPWSSRLGAPRVYDLEGTPGNRTLVLSGGTGRGDAGLGNPYPMDLSMLSASSRAEVAKSETRCGSPREMSMS